MSSSKIFNISTQTIKNDDNITTWDFCQTRRQQFLPINGVPKIILLTSIGAFSVTGIFINSLVAFLLYITRQLNNRSLRLMFYATIFDILGCLSTFYKFPIFHAPAEVSCHYLITERFVSPITMFGSRYIICVIAFDRFMRLKYLQEYEVKFPTSWYRLVLAISCLGVLYQCCITLVLQVFYGGSLTMKFSLPVNVMVFMTATILYLISLRMLYQHKKTQKVISNTNSDIMKITKVYFILYATSSGLLLGLYQIDRSGRGRFGSRWNDTSGFALLTVLNIIPNLTGIINAVVILFVNRPIKNKMSSFGLFRRWIRRSTRVPKIRNSEQKTNENDKIPAQSK